MFFKKFNWPAWAGFFISIIAFLSYFFVFVSFPLTRDFPWANLLLFAIAAALLVVGIRRGFAAERSRPARSKVAASVLTILSVTVLGLFIFTIFIMGRNLPASTGAPQVGQAAPDFTLTDTNGKVVSLAELRSTPVNGKPTKGVLLIFYRGYW